MNRYDKKCDHDVQMQIDSPPSPPNKYILLFLFPHHPCTIFKIQFNLFKIHINGKAIRNLSFALLATFKKTPVSLELIQK